MRSGKSLLLTAAVALAVVVGYEKVKSGNAIKTAH